MYGMGIEKLERFASSFSCVHHYTDAFLLSSLSLNFLGQVYSIACADAMAEYLAKKEQRGDPASALEEGAKVRACIDVGMFENMK